jgi:uncharacterized protein YaeQ
MDTKITSIRLSQDTKYKLQTIKEHPRETDDELLTRLIKYVKEKEGLK